MFHETHFPFHSHTQPTSFPSDIYLPSFSYSCVDDSSTFPSFPLSVSDSDGTHNSPNSANDVSGSSIIHDLSDATITTTDAIRKSTRVHKPPYYLSSYQCNNVSTLSAHWCNLVHVSYISSHCTLVESSFYTEAAAHSLWVATMEAELYALHKNHTWDLVPLLAKKKKNQQFQMGL